MTNSGTVASNVYAQKVRECKNILQTLYLRNAIKFDSLNDKYIGLILEYMIKYYIDSPNDKKRYPVKPKLFDLLTRIPTSSFTGISNADINEEVYKNGLSLINAGMITVCVVRDDPSSLTIRRTLHGDDFVNSLNE